MRVGLLRRSGENQGGGEIPQEILQDFALEMNDPRPLPTHTLHNMSSRMLNMSQFTTNSMQDSIDIRASEMEGEEEEEEMEEDDGGKGDSGDPKKQKRGGRNGPPPVRITNIYDSSFEDHRAEVGMEESLNVSDVLVADDGDSDQQDITVATSSKKRKKKIDWRKRMREKEKELDSRAREMEELSARLKASDDEKEKLKRSLESSSKDLNDASTRISQLERDLKKSENLENLLKEKEKQLLDVESRLDEEKKKNQFLKEELLSHSENNDVVVEREAKFKTIIDNMQKKIAALTEELALNKEKLEDRKGVAQDESPMSPARSRSDSVNFSEVEEQNGKLKKENLELMQRLADMNQIIEREIGERERTQKLEREMELQRKELSLLKKEVLKRKDDEYERQKMEIQLRASGKRPIVPSVSDEYESSPEPDVPTKKEKVKEMRRNSDDSEGVFVSDTPPSRRAVAPPEKRRPSLDVPEPPTNRDSDAADRKEGRKMVAKTSKLSVEESVKMANVLEKELVELGLEKNALEGEYQKMQSVKNSRQKIQRKKEIEDRLEVINKTVSEKRLQIRTLMGTV